MIRLTVTKASVTLYTDLIVKLDHFLLKHSLVGHNWIFVCSILQINNQEHIKCIIVRNNNSEEEKNYCLSKAEITVVKSIVILDTDAYSGERWCFQNYSFILVESGVSLASVTTHLSCSSPLISVIFSQIPFHASFMICGLSFITSYEMMYVDPENINIYFRRAGHSSNSLDTYCLIWCVYSFSCFERFNTMIKECFVYMVFFI